jgi:hypothetical protein
MDRSMKLRLFGLILLALLPLSAHISWLGDYEVAHHLAQRQHKKLLVVLVKSECKACRELIRRIGSDPSLQRKITAQYIPVILTAGPGAIYPIELYYSTTFPTLFWVNAETETFLFPPCYGAPCIEELARTVASQ